MAKSNFITCDIASSETRISANGSEVLRIPNNCVFLDGPTPDSFEAGQGKEGALEAIVEGFGDEKVYVLFGEMASRYSPVNLRPSPLEAKYKQRINLLSIIVGTAFARLENGNTPADLYVVVPPVEVNKARAALTESLGGEYRVEFPKLDRAARVKFTSIFCYEESRMAGEAFMAQLDDEYKKGTCLSVDIGAGTTDLALFIDGVFYERSARTYKVGGNTSREFLIDDIAAEYDCELPITEAENVIKTGKLKLGNTKEDVVLNVNASKQQAANLLVESTQQYFRAVGVPIQTVNALLLSGGGSLTSECENSRSLASYLVDALKAVCSGIDAIEYKGDARLANMDGLCIIARKEANEGIAAKAVGGKEAPTN